LRTDLPEQAAVPEGQCSRLAHSGKRQRRTRKVPVNEMRSGSIGSWRAAATRSARGLCRASSALDRRSGVFTIRRAWAV
jgi:hypothetical protein